MPRKTHEAWSLEMASRTTITTTPFPLSRMIRRYDSQSLISVLFFFFSFCLSPARPRQRRTASIRGACDPRNFALEVYEWKHIYGLLP